ncbi:hypothetical protein QN366_04855 [Pseudomonas sp. CCC3.2]|uniref:hypothetical protein n=1 Tax=unclassified Pseudomonas TaxID=196821 RepID=UPI002AB3C055|nr:MULTISPECIES: hypothetical protein [unclassified Pseudomonas]MDY7559957.1 hypothetical protein [Pseudomonas sp. AB6]MEA9994543.1 hypothetical protein [Pseudomonas sp. AA4]MEB0085688.1 hypothetical protein [Pseudomonas sp. RTI1]MEB0125987.1 hypothetical protein [Pseudomonas sp. CCC1.2]MEB0152791.1 hypothetical protein [Pseudomonas sp. CCC4.3]
MLTDTQLSDARRYAGYPFRGDLTLGDGLDLAHGWVSPIIWQTLQHRLTTLRPEEEVRIITFLTTLAGLETDVTGSSSNLDTDQAAVWTHNKNEVNDRMSLYRLWRRELCAFIGVPPGPGLGGSGSTTISRC